MSPGHRLLDPSLRYYSPAWRRRRNGADQGRDERKLIGTMEPETPDANTGGGSVLLALVSTPSAAEPELELVKLTVSEGKDIRFAHLITRDGLSPGQIRDILQDNQGFLWFRTPGAS